MNHSNRTPIVCDALAPYGTSIFTDITALVKETGAVNLSQGFPDFDGPAEIREIAARRILDGPNQYSAPNGMMPLKAAVQQKMRRFYGVEVDGDTEITVTAGATEGLAATLLGLINPGDEVVLLEPFYDLYPAMISRAGGTPVYVPLRKMDMSLHREALGAACNERTRAIVINNPQNPCGKVYTREELEFLAGLCEQYDAIAIGDEVYEHILFDGRSHVTLLDVAGLRDRAVVVSSTAKTFSMTGWKLGYTIASPHLTYGIRMAHQFIAYCIPAMFQEAMAHGVAMDNRYYDELAKTYAQKREWLCNALSDAGLDVIAPEGTYYATVNIAGLDFEDDLAFVRYLAKEVRVAAIPSSYFWHNRRDGKEFVRFCFCKRDTTLQAAVDNLRRWKR